MTFDGTNLMSSASDSQYQDSIGYSPDTTQDDPLQMLLYRSETQYPLSQRLIRPPLPPPPLRPLPILLYILTLLPRSRGEHQPHEMIAILPLIRRIEDKLPPFSKRPSYGHWLLCFSFPFAGCLLSFALCFVGVIHIPRRDGRCGIGRVVWEREGWGAGRREVERAGPEERGEAGLDLDHWEWDDLICWLLADQHLL